ncbi:hypothetical protein NC652_006153 [Populus alba x Populus x berolinensis]|nr:hypothetical protein NC652_006153 [Populus alba x Populus x berolinensis]
MPVSPLRLLVVREVSLTCKGDSMHQSLMFFCLEAVVRNYHVIVDMYFPERNIVITGKREGYLFSVPGGFQLKVCRCRSAFDTNTLGLKGPRKQR